jgi:hypothetical protein
MLVENRCQMRDSARRLRMDTLEFCSKPSTLVGAAVTGAVIARVAPLGGDDCASAEQQGESSALAQIRNSALKMLLVHGLTKVLVGGNDEF